MAQNCDIGTYETEILHCNMNLWITKVEKVGIAFNPSCQQLAYNEIFNGQWLTRVLLYVEDLNSAVLDRYDIFKSSSLHEKE